MRIREKGHTQPVVAPPPARIHILFYIAWACSFRANRLQKATPRAESTKHAKVARNRAASSGTPCCTRRCHERQSL